MEHSELSPLGRKYAAYIELDPAEKIICEIRKHPFGLLLVWLIGLFIAVSVLAVTIGTLYLLSGDKLGLGSDLDAGKPIVAAIGFIVMFLVLIMTGISSWLYRHNLVLVTSEKIAEVTYVSIFNRKVTQLDLSDIQNVAVEQKGVFPRVFGYGTLFIETAGERENVTLTYTPLPYGCAKDIVGAREVRKGLGAPAVSPPSPVPTSKPTPQPTTQPAPGPGSTPEAPGSNDPTH